ncbi:MAG: SHOCT domain-containing protein [Ruminococcaceae bacterium]|nr:SHOCT domain-containing protein [Oscillospiraceae bacterium]
MLNIDKLRQLKELLDMGVISQDEFEKQKQALIQPENTKEKNIGLTVTIILVAIICFSIIFGGDTDPKDLTESTQVSTETNSILTEFAGKCPVEVYSSMYDNIIGVPEIKCTFNNNTDKEIAAIKLYFSPRDVYGADVNTIFTTNELYTDNPIAPGASSSRSWQLLDSEIKSGDVYIYSVYFSDGTEWGNKEASISDIKKYAHKISTKY